MKLVTLFLSILLLCGCSQQAEKPIPSPVLPPNGILEKSDETKELTSENTAQYEYQYANMSIPLPEGWSSQNVGGSIEMETQNGTLRADPAEEFGLDFWPEAQPEIRFSLRCRPYDIAVCGTGVAIEEISLENGLAAVQYSEQIGENCSVLLVFQDLPGCYTLEASYPKETWLEYQDELEFILNGAELANGLQREAEAIEKAKEVCPVDYDGAAAVFDLYGGLWQIDFYRGERHLCDIAANVWIAPDGSVADIWIPKG